MATAALSALLLLFPVEGAVLNGPVPPATASLALLTEAAAAYGATCLDGSPAGRYIVRGVEAGKWVIYQQGGGWCSSDEQCLERANTTLGSSTTYPNTSATVMLEEDFLSNDPVTNPAFANWNKVYLPYCDGSSQVSDLADPVSVGNSTIYYRGARVLRAVIAFLKSEGLAAATEVVIAGCSAGGLSTYLHADKWTAALPGARVVAMPDSGFFLNWPLSNSSAFPANTTYPWRMWWTASRQNATGALLPACLAAHAPADFWLCMFAENIAPHLATPTFALQSVHDSYQIGSILHCPNASDPANWPSINAYGAVLGTRLRTALRLDAPAPPRHGAALDSCTHHCGGSAWIDISFNSSAGDLESSPSSAAAPWVTQGGSFAAWYNGGAALWTQGAEYPCSWCCKKQGS